MESDTLKYSHINPYSNISSIMLILKICTNILVGLSASQSREIDIKGTPHSLTVVGAEDGSLPKASKT